MTDAKRDTWILQMAIVGKLRDILPGCRRFISLVKCGHWWEVSFLLCMLRLAATSVCVVFPQSSLIAKNSLRFLPAILLLVSILTDKAQGQLCLGMGWRFAAHWSCILPSENSGIQIFIYTDIFLLMGLFAHGQCQPVLYLYLIARTIEVLHPLNNLG